MSTSDFFDLFAACGGDFSKLESDTCNAMKIKGQRLNENYKKQARYQALYASPHDASRLINNTSGRNHIMTFRDEYYFLSNMYPCRVEMEIGGRRLAFPCAESAFQACKCIESASAFACGGKYPDGFKAKRAGRKVRLRQDWDEVKTGIMANVLEAKFSQNPDLMAQLLDVRGEIVEDNTWHDTYWGRCGGHGSNILGRLLMQIRDLPPERGGNAKQWLLNLCLEKGGDLT